MSKSSAVLKEFGSLSICQNSNITTGSTRSTQVTVVPGQTTLTDTTQTLTLAQVKSGILTITPTANRTLTLPTAALFVDSFTDVAIGYSIKFHVIALGASAFSAIIAPGDDGTSVGSMTVQTTAAVSGTDVQSSGSGQFLVRLTNVTSGSETYDVIRLA